jgi:hypothetical protein
MSKALITVPQAVEGEVLGNGLFLEANPFLVGRFTWVEVPEGAKLDAYAEAAAAKLPADYDQHLELWIDETRIVRSLWQRVTPKPGHTVYARVRPQNGKTGKNVLRAVLMIAVAVAAMAVGAAIGGIPGMIAAAAITTLGTFAINKLIPAPGLTGDNSQKDPKYQLTGSSNQFQPYAPIPRVYGKLRLFPMLAAHPYTEIVGNKQYLRMLLIVGWGPIKITDIKLGNTPITAYKNVEVEIIEGGPSGWAGNVPLTLYNRKVTEEAMFTHLTSAGGASVAHTTPANTVEISCDLSFPAGLINIDKSGDTDKRTIVVKVEYRLVGSGTWLLAPLESAYNDSTQTVNTGAGTISVTGKTHDTVRANARFKVTAGQYDVRLTRTTADAANTPSGAQNVDDTYWTTLRSFGTDQPVIQDQVCLIAIRMQATDQLNGIPQQINCLAEAYVPVYGIGAEMLTNGDGSSIVGWTAGGGATLSSTGGHLRVLNGASANGYASQAVTAVVGHRYQISYDKYQSTATDARVKVGVAANDATYLSEGSTGDATRATYVVTATSTSLVITLMAEGAAATGAEFDSVSIRDLDANSAWTYQITRSPAWAFCDILRRRGGQSYIADSRIDITGSINTWAQACGTIAPNANEPRWTFDAIIQGGTVIDALRQIAAVGRAAYTMRDGKFAVVQDKVQTTPVQIITPKNSWGYSGSRTYVDLPHAYRVEFQNAEQDYRTDERIVYDDGYDISTATKFEVLQMFGCTTPTFAFREGRYHIATARLRPEEHTVNMDIESIRCTMGDRVQLAHDVIAVGKAWGRIVSLTTASTNTIAFNVDEDCIFEVGKTYQLRVRHADNTISLRTVTMTGGPGTTRSLACSPETTAGGPQPDDLFMFGETGIESAPMIVRKIEPLDDLAAKITMTNYDPAVYTADTGTIPSFFSYMGVDFAKEPPPLPDVTIRADGSVHQLNNGNWILNRLGVDIVNKSGRIEVEGNQVQYREVLDLLWRDAGPNLYPPGGITVYVDGVTQGHAYQVRVRSKGANGIYSDWVQPADIVVIGTSVLPSVPTSTSVTPEYRSNIIRWTNPRDLDLAYIEILASLTHTLGSAVVVGRSITGEWTHQNLTGGSTWWYWVRAVDFAGNVSTSVDIGSGVALTIALYEGIGADNVLNPSEKQLIIREFTQLTNEKTNIDTQATNFGITTEKTNYDNAYSTLNSYLGALSPAYTDTSQNTTIVRTTWNSNWAALYSTRQILLNKIDSIAATLANWPSISDPTGTMPDSNATPGDGYLPDSGFELDATGKIGTGFSTFGPRWTGSAGLVRTAIP